MRTTRIFFDGSLHYGEQLTLSRDQIHYLGRVLRLKSGSRVNLFNGTGSEFACEIMQLDNKSGTISVGEPVFSATESPLNICLALGLSKGDRFDWAIQKATEWGVTEIQPLFSERTEIRLSGDRIEKKVLHWQAVVRSACEQSGRTKLPQVQPPAHLDSYLKRHISGEKLVLDPQADARLSTHNFDVSSSSVALLIGPEGGLSEGELARIKQVGFVAVSLGPRVLRTETAPVAAISVIQSRLGDG